VALSVWSWWWPHSDARQLWAAAGMAVAVAAVAISAQSCRMAGISSSPRTAIARLAAVTFVSGAALLAWLIVTTAPHR
jgi:hypothetical protein